MDEQTEKCVMVLDEGLPLGLAANTAGILGITLGKRIPEAVGQDVTDRSGRTHPGIIEFPVPILRADRETLYELRERLYEPAFAALTVVDFSDVAQGCKTYDEYIAKVARIGADRLHYLGLAFCGAKKLVNKLTGSLPLLR